MKQKVVFASGNKGKLKEVRMILEDYDVYSLEEMNIHIDIIEDGVSFEENAVIKAEAIRDYLQQQGAGNDHYIIMADDSGLEVDYLNKEPGVYSARYMGETTSYDIKNQSIINRLDGISGNDRSARFVCVIAAGFTDGRETLTSRGTVEGIIGMEPLGSGGFGYDPIFYLPERGLSMAELDPGEKNQISHRGKALRMMNALLKERLS